MTERATSVWTRLAPIAAAALFLGSTLRAVEPGLPSKTAIWALRPAPLARRIPIQSNATPITSRSSSLAYASVRSCRTSTCPRLISPLPRRCAGSASTCPSHRMRYRTRAFDAALLQSIRDGARQVVVLGAGFDSRGYRFQGELRGVRFMEVDYPPTQAYKTQRVKEILGVAPQNVTFVPMDFTKDDLLQQLTNAGYSERDKTFFLWEGVTHYLPEAAIKDTLHFVRDHAASGSRLAFNYT